MDQKGNTESSGDIVSNLFLKPIELVGDLSPHDHSTLMFTHGQTNIGMGSYLKCVRRISSFDRTHYVLLQMSGSIGSTLILVGTEKDNGVITSLALVRN